MAIEVPITRELSDYEPKLIGPFTIRQCICLVCCAPCVYLILRFLSPLLTDSAAMFLCFVPVSVAYAFGWAKPYGMRTEKFIKSVFVTRFLAPQNRKYKTKNTIEVVLKDAEQDWQKAELEKIMKSETKKEKKARLKAFKQSKRYKRSDRAVK